MEKTKERKVARASLSGAMKVVLAAFALASAMACAADSRNWTLVNLDRGSAHPAFEHAVGWSFTPDVSGMAYEERESYLGSIGQGPGGHEERK